MLRLFTGIEISGTQRLQLQMLQTGLRNVRWVEPADFHITLHFLGTVTNREADTFVDALDQGVWAQPEITLGELKTFGGSQPRSVFASVAANDALSRLQAAHARVATQLGLRHDKRKFTPHVTIARLTQPPNLDNVLRYLSQFGGFSSPPFKPERFVLYSARSSSGGGPYRVEQSWPLQTQPST